MGRGAQFYETRSLLFCTAKVATGIWVFAVLLDIGMMIVSILAYTGAQSEDDTAVIKRTHITFPTAGNHVQRAEIALVCSLSKLLFLSGRFQTNVLPRPRWASFSTPRWRQSPWFA